MSPSSYISYAKSYYGASILVHGTQVYPQSVDKITFAQPGCDVTVAVMPSVVVSEPAIRDLSLDKRNCFFDDEVSCIGSRWERSVMSGIPQRKLRTTTRYTFQSCIFECAVDTILLICNCLPFYYAEVRLRPFFDGKRQCTLEDSHCLRDNRRNILSFQYEEEIQN